MHGEDERHEYVWRFKRRQHTVFTDYTSTPSLPMEQSQSSYLNLSPARDLIRLSASVACEIPCNGYWLCKSAPSPSLANTLVSPVDDNTMAIVYCVIRGLVLVHIPVRES